MHLVIDGATGEGGGQIVRSAVTLAAATGRTVEVVNIRAGRSRPGLARQHVVAVQAAARVSGGYVAGDEIGSGSLLFQPGTGPTQNAYEFKIESAGSATLVFQTVFPLLARRATPTEITIRGGTHNPMAPNADYLAHVFGPVAASLGWPFRLECEAPGFFPEGGGTLKATISPAQPIPIALDQFCSENPTITGYSCGSQLPDGVYDRADQTLRGRLPRAEVHRHAARARSKGFAFSLVAETPGGVPAGYSALGERGRPVEQVVETALTDFSSRWPLGGLDEHLADQLVVLAGLTPGKHRWRTQHVTEHLRTGLWLIEQFGLAKTELADSIITVQTG
jgi:RNA 3'-terminal phosphate cyclase (ATP)